MAGDKWIVNLWIERAAAPAKQQALLRQTAAILETAQAGAEPCELTILLGADGSIFITTDSRWAIDRLMAERQGRAAWRVRRSAHGTIVDAMAGAARCRFEARARSLSPNPPRAGNVRLLPAAWG